jgi:predicted transcriptional regulator
MLPDNIPDSPQELEPIARYEPTTYLMTRRAVQDYIDEHDFDQGEIEDIWEEFEDTGEIEV